MGLTKSELLTKKYSVYSLVCPITNEIKYIGLSSNLVSRYTNHLSGGSYGATADWILKTLRPKGLLPIMNELESGLSAVEARAMERKYISDIQKEFGTLLNVRGVTFGVAAKPIINFLNKEKAA